MAVPTTGSFLMFGTGSNTTIAGAIIEGGASSETVASTLNFNALKALANINKFDAEFKEGATTLEQIVKSTQFRGYPIISLCDFNGLTIICNPTSSAEKTLTIETQNNSTTFPGTGDQNDAYFGRFEPWVLKQDTYPFGLLTTSSIRTIIGTDDLNTSLAWPTSPSTLYINVTASFFLNNIQYGNTYKALLDTNIVFGTNYSVGDINWDNYQEAKVVWEINDGPTPTTTTTTTAAPTTTTTTTSTTTTTTAAPTTTTTTTTTTAAPNPSILISPSSYPGTITSCAATATLQVYYSGIIGDGNTLYTDSGLTTFFDGDGDFYKIGNDYVGRISGIGIISNYTSCSTTTTTTTTAGPLYYTLNPCNGGDPLYDTTITPILTNQRYVDPISGNFWVWDNASGTSSPQQTVNSSLQIVSGQSGCP
jgi:hypothetical protein